MRIYLLYSLIPAILILSCASAYAEEVKAGIWLINVDRFDTSTGSYNVDFYIWFRWSEGSERPVNFEFANGRAASIDVIRQSDGYYEARVRGTFVKKLDFANYPFDEHALTIEVEDKVKGIDDLVFVPDRDASGIDEELSIPGWYMKSWSIDVEEHRYPDATYSRLIFSFTLARYTLSTLLKSILPITVISTIALLTFFISPKNFAQRIGIGVTTLLAGVAAHLNLTGQLPQIGYLTFADKIMIIAYGIFLHGLITTTLVIRALDRERGEYAQYVNRRALELVPVIVGILAVLLFLGMDVVIVGAVNGWLAMG
ncbi:MAG: hypothetical protein RMJ59_08330 [Candidatus Nitrosocaldus sp.]|nr:hypothetical protein [Candidatus Nitrosocaldus sp.]MDW8276367.1 hypothetical protein [Candidatus Nitrosocaldus sp.]